MKMPEYVAYFKYIHAIENSIARPTGPPFLPNQRSFGLERTRTQGSATINFEDGVVFVVTRF